MNQEMIKTHKNDFRSQSGNALWIILIAVALLAALTATMIRSADTTEQTGDIERYRIQASEIMRTAAGIAQTVRNMQMQGISENVISFQANDLPAAYNNANCTADNCRVFHPRGGGLNYSAPSSGWLDSSHSSLTHYGEWLISTVNALDGAGTDNPDMILFIPAIREALCRQINVMQRIHGATDPIPTSPITQTPFNGTVPATATTIIVDMGRHKSGCFQDTGAGNPYMYYHVLIER